MRNAIDRMELAMMGLGDFVNLPDIFDGSPNDLEIAPRMTVGQMREACIALSELNRIVNSDEYTPAKLKRD